MNWDKGEAEAAVLVPVVRTAVDSVRHLAAARVGVPTAAAYNAVGAIGIQAPLPYIPAHIIQTEFVGLFFSNRVRPAGIAIIPRNFIDIITAAVFIPFALVSATGSIFPLDFCRKSKLPATGGFTALIQFFAKRHSIIPADTFYWTIPRATIEICRIIRLLQWNR